VQQLRAALKAQNISEAPLKDFIITYQKINGILGDTTNAEADQYQRYWRPKAKRLLLNSNGENKYQTPT
jgi:hypothetical protein